MNASKIRTLLLRAAVGVVALLVLAQVVPYGRNHTNPEAREEPVWPSPAARALAVRACFDCHSNETRWPWYSHVAPVSWLVQNHVDVGRHVLNFSEWSKRSKHAREAPEAVREGEMPMPGYPEMHPEARLTPSEKQELEAALKVMVGEAGAEKDEPKKD